MAKQAESVCIRCGQTRIFFKTWKDKSEGKGSMITYTLSVCPDAECQKIVDEKFTKMREQREASEEKRKSIVISKRTKAVV